MSGDDPFDLVGDVLDGQFRVDRFVGEGDLSVVYQGHHLGVDAPVAIKCLNLPATLDPALVRPLVESFRDASRLHYRLARGSLHIAQSIASGQTLAPRTGGTVPYLVREWFEGESLASDLAARRSEGKTGRTLEEAMALLEPAIEGVVYAHGQGVAHLSLNPSNLFIARRSDGSALKVLDFGVARTMNELSSGLPDDSQRAEGLRVLFPAYAAPEQLDRSAGETGSWTDVYSIAIVFMELLSDRVVMQGGDTGALVERVLDYKYRPTPNAHGLHLTRNLELVLSRAVARAPPRRQKDAGAFWKDVKSATRGTGSRAMPTARSEAPAPHPLRAKSATLMGIAPSIAVVGAVPGRRSSPSVTSVGTLPMSFEPGPASARSEPDLLVGVASAARPAPLPDPLPPTAEALPAEELLGDEPPAEELPAEELPAEELPAEELLAEELLAEELPAEAPAAEVPPAEAPPEALPPAPVITATLPAPLEPLPAWRHAVIRLPRPNVVALMAGGCAVALGVPVLLLVVLLHGGAPAPPSAPGRPLVAPVPSASAVDSASPPATSAASNARFSVAAARRALDAASREVSKCKRGKAWGVASATVTFANDGSVARVAIGPPLGGTDTGKCVQDTMSAVRVPPFGGDSGVFVARFYVAAH